MSMLEQFFSLNYAGRGDLFQGLAIWQEKSFDEEKGVGEKSPDGDYKYRQIQGTYPVISLSFANVKEANFQNTKWRICQILTDLYHKDDFLLEGNLLSDAEKAEY